MKNLVLFILLMVVSTTTAFANHNPSDKYKNSNVKTTITTSTQSATSNNKNVLLSRYVKALESANNDEVASLYEALKKEGIYVTEVVSLSFCPEVSYTYKGVEYRERFCSKLPSSYTYNQNKDSNIRSATQTTSIKSTTATLSQIQNMIFNYTIALINNNKSEIERIGYDLSMQRSLPVIVSMGGYNCMGCLYEYKGREYADKYCSKLPAEFSYNQNKDSIRESAKPTPSTEYTTAKLSQIQSMIRNLVIAIANDNTNETKKYTLDLLKEEKVRVLSIIEFYGCFICSYEYEGKEYRESYCK